MYINSAILIPSILHKCDSVVEDTLNVLLHIVLQMVAAISHSFILKVIFAEVCCTVDYMRDSCLFEGFLILGDHVTSKVKEFIYDLGAHSAPNHVLVLFAGSTLEIEIVINNFILLGSRDQVDAPWSS